MKFYRFIITVIVFCNTNSFAQFPGIVGTAGSTAIHKDSSIFVAWATTCTVQRGWQQINDTSLGYVTTGDTTMAVGHADGVQVVSLGDGGSAILGFEKPIKNGPGFDFAVFENAFIDEFLELAFVEVSSDGVNFYRFKATSNTQTDVQMGPFDYNADATLINNLAGKYRAMYGTPFDLEEMIGISGLNVDSITYVKVIDVVGSINPLYASYDQNNHIINEHFPTPYPQGGFDLDAVGVINQQVNGINDISKLKIELYPNPFTDLINLKGNYNSIAKIELTNQYGELLYTNTQINSSQLDFIGYTAGVYFVKLIMQNGTIEAFKIIRSHQ